MELIVHQLNMSSPMELDLQFLCQLVQLHSALACHVSTHSGRLTLSCSNTMCLLLPEMLWVWGVQAHLWQLVCGTLKLNVLTTFV